MTKNRLFDGLDVVAEGNIQVVRDPSGAVQSEVTTWWDGWQQWGHWATTEQDVLKDVLGSPITVAVDGVVSKDLQLFGDFGDVVDAAAWTLVTGFTGQPVTDGLTEFATRTYDAASKVWLQDDSFRGTTTRSASLNRYAYVEGAPESFVDVLGFFRAAAAIQARKLAAAQAAYDAAVKAYNAIVSNAHMQGRLFAREVGQIQAQADARAASDAWAVTQREAARASVFSTSTTRTPSANNSLWDRASRAVSNAVSTAAGATKMVASVAWDGTKMAASVAWDATKTVASLAWDGTRMAASVAWDATKTVASAAWDRGTTLIQYQAQVDWRRIRDPLQATRDDMSLTSLAENAVATFQILGGGAHLVNEGKYCGNAGECLQGGFTPIDSDGNGQAITIGHTVTFPAGYKIESDWVEHEFTHVLQYEILGGVLFGLDYGLEQAYGVTFGHKSKEEAYWDQSTEQWARAVATDPDIAPGQNPFGRWFEDSRS